MKQLGIAIGIPFGLLLLILLLVAGRSIYALYAQSVWIRWGRVTKAVYNPEKRTIYLKAGWMNTVVLFCTEENYPLIEKAVRTKMPRL